MAEAAPLLLSRHARPAHAVLSALQGRKSAYVQPCASIHGKLSRFQGMQARRTQEYAG